MPGRILTLLIAAALPLCAQSGSPGVVISQVYGGGGNTGATLRNDFIELFNRGTAAVSLEGWSVQYASASGETWQVTALAGSIEPGRYYLVQQAQGAGGTASLPAPDAAGAIAMSATAGKVALVASTAALSGAAPTTGVVDFVGYGAAGFFEKNPAPALTNTTALLRRGNGCQDTDDNAADFQTGAPNPRNSGAPSNPCSGFQPPQPLEAPIHEIQGPGPSSPLAGKLVAAAGIVTARKSNGFFIQAPEHEADDDPATSEGLFVFTSTAPPASAAIGSYVRVTGTVAEFRPAADRNSPPLTELVDPVVSVIATGQRLPEPVGLSSTTDLERYEGMRVRIAALTATSGTDSAGVFFGVLQGTRRPFREPGIPVLDSLPEGAPAGVPRFDGNPERLRVDTDGQPGARRLEVTSGAVARNLTGPLDYGSRTYTILPDPDSPPEICCLAAAQPAEPPAEGEYSIATINLRRFFSGAPERVRKASLAIRKILRSPDILAVQEVDDFRTLEELARAIDRDAAAAGEPAPGYLVYLEPGNDPGGINVGMLVKPGRVEIAAVRQEGKDIPENDRPPLVLDARLGRELPVTVYVNHLRSLLDIEDPRVRDKRKAQAEFLAWKLQREQPGNLVVLGDFNAFQFSDGYVDVMGTVLGAPAPPGQVVLPTADHLEPDLVNLIETVPESERYSYVYQGDAQALDHILVSQPLRPYVKRFAYVRLGADFPEAWASDPARPERLTDHDAALAVFTVRPAAPPLQ